MENALLFRVDCMILYYIMKCAKIHPIFPGLYPRNFNKMRMKFLYTLQKEKEFLFSEKSCMIKVQQNAHRALKIEGGKNTKSYYVEGGFSHLIHMTAAHLW